MLTGIVIVIWLLYHLEGKQLESELNVLVKKNEVAQTKWQNLQQEYRRIEHIFNPIPAWYHSLIIKIHIIILSSYLPNY